MVFFYPYSLGKRNRKGGWIGFRQLDSVYSSAGNEFWQVNALTFRVFFQYWFSLKWRFFRYSKACSSISSITPCLTSLIVINCMTFSLTTGRQKLFLASTGRMIAKGNSWRNFGFHPNTRFWLERQHRSLQMNETEYFTTCDVAPRACKLQYALSFHKSSGIIKQSWLVRWYWPFRSLITSEKMHVLPIKSPYNS